MCGPLLFTVIVKAIHLDEGAARPFLLRENNERERDSSPRKEPRSGNRKKAHFCSFIEGVCCRSGIVIKLDRRVSIPALFSSFLPPRPSPSSSHRCHHRPSSHLPEPRGEVVVVGSHQCPSFHRRVAPRGGRHHTRPEGKPRGGMIFSPHGDSTGKGNDDRPRNDCQERESESVV